MNPFRPRRRNRRDMIVLGGWLFADLLLGLAMIFLVANTVGAPPPTPTATPTPDELATAEASFAAVQAENEATREALQSDLAMMEQTAIAQENQVASERLAATQTAEARQIAATQTAEAEATEAAMSESELATREARATQEAVAAQATISAFATEQAESGQSQAILSAELATISAQATEVAGNLEAQATTQAEIAAVATEQAESGADVQATLAALEASNQTSADALATAEAEQAALQERQSQIEATATAFVAVAAPGSLSPSSIEEVIQVDLSGVLSGDEGAVQQAQETIRDVFEPYAEAEGCQAGFALTNSRAPELGQGVELSRAVNDLLVETVPEVFGETVFEAIALPNTTPAGEVILQIFLYSGCEIIGGGEG
ncbi:MAG TPA: hypothetical protein VGR22_02225 [Thermomicrobiales bacterium]|nr:hypothetical protein [Thermomicrobiales bacterium]